MAQSGQDRASALRLHRSGQLGAALAAYEAMLAAAPGDADILGLMGVLALQDGRSDDAEALLNSALAARGEAPVYLRNLNNYLALLKTTERVEDARALVAGDLPEWPEDAAPDAAERETVLSLIEALLVLDQPRKARNLLNKALPQRSSDAVALSLDGRLCLAEDNASAALGILARAFELAPDDYESLIALGCAQDQLGLHDANRQTADQLSRGWPVYSAPSKPSQRAAILVLSPTPKSVDRSTGSLRRLHFSSNYPGEIEERMRDEYRFISLFADLPADALPEQLPSADVVFNNIVNSEPMNIPGRLETVRAVVDWIGLPVINHPDQVFQTTRQKNVLLLKGIPNLKVPRIERYRSDLGSPAEIAADVAKNFDFPVILRRTNAHESSDLQFLEDREPAAALLSDAAAVIAHLERWNWHEFYAIEYVDLKRKDGFYRKLRAAYFDNEVIVNVAAINRLWMVSGWRAKPEGIDFYRANPQTIEECNSIVRDPEGMLGAEVLATLEAIRDRIPLDVFGVDFDVDDTGKVVFFEASAAMILNGKNQSAPIDVRLPGEHFERMDDAFRKLVTRRIADTRGSRPPE
jgi:Flp pilus assembly protein TadD